MFGLIATATTTVMAPFITVTIQLMIAFVILIWLSLSLIFAMTKIIDFLLGQPFLGWILTGNINSINNIEFITKQGMFSFTAPIMIFLYVGIVISLFLWLIYFICFLIPFSNVGSLKVRGIGIFTIVTATFWIPFIYSLLTITTNGLMLGLYALFKQKKQIEQKWDLNLLKQATINNLFSLKELFSQIEIKQINPSDPKIEELINLNFGTSEKLNFLSFIDLWNANFISGKINVKSIDSLINTLKSVDVEKFSNLALEQQTFLMDFSSVFASMSQMKNYYNGFVNSISLSQLKEFNLLFLDSKILDLNSSFIPMDILKWNSLDKEQNTINNFLTLLIYNKNYLDISFSQTIVNVLYSLSLGKNTIFVPGWDSLSITGFNIFWLIPLEIKTPFLNINIFLFYNIKMLVVGGIINSILLPSIFVFGLILVQRFVYLTFWPLMALFSLARTGQGDAQFIKKKFSELFYKFINLIAFGIMWNFISIITILIFEQISKLNIFENEKWILEVLSIFILIGIIISSLTLAKTFLSELEQDRSIINVGASEINASKNQLEKSVKQTSYKTKNSIKKAKNNFNNNESVKNFKSGFNSAQGQGFKAQFIAGKMALKK